MTKYTAAQLDEYALRDLISDAEVSEDQAANGPYYADRIGGGREITTDPVKIEAAKRELLEYAAKCRAKIAKFANGGAHDAVLAG
jgi:hypothetical protein